MTDVSTEARLIITPDGPSVAQAAAKHVVGTLRQALASRPVAHVALTGGSTAGALYRLLAEPPARDELDWDRVQFWWGDDRAVPEDDPDSNAGLAMATLFHMGGYEDLERGLRIPSEHVHPIPLSRALVEAPDQRAAADLAAERYAGELRADLPKATGAGWPIFDLVLLGIGPDGHILSCFPGSPALRDDAPLALGIDAPTHVEPHLPRVTLNPRIVPAARAVTVMAHGEAKADVLAHVILDPVDVERFPAQYARIPTAAWFLDEGCASELPPDFGQRSPGA
ncbi:MAG TPA: 6-phosphogluconolactonase [Candidatus Limnocylindrales bacterium]|jgi:6-phosphogluconolactonase|nr:6-phosphogluconolactonase [Candidatus Limnocylindrales bacterium]